MENSQSKAIFIGFDLFMFLILLLGAILMLQAGENIQTTQDKLISEKQNLIISKDSPAKAKLYEDSGENVYENLNNKTVIKHVNGDTNNDGVADGEIVSSATVYTDILNLPSDIYKVYIDNIDEPITKDQITEQIDTGDTGRIYNRITSNADTYVKRYIAFDDNGNEVTDGTGTIHVIRYTKIK